MLRRLPSGQLMSAVSMRQSSTPMRRGARHGPSGWTFTDRVGCQYFFACSPLSQPSWPFADTHMPPAEAHTVRATARLSLRRSSAVVTRKNAAATAAATTVPNASRVMLSFMLLLHVDAPARAACDRYCQGILFVCHVAASPVPARPTAEVFTHLYRHAIPRLRLDATLRARAACPFLTE